MHGEPEKIAWRKKVKTAFGNWPEEILGTTKGGFLRGELLQRM